MGNAGSGTRPGKGADTAPPSPSHKDDHHFDFDNKLHVADVALQDEDGPLYAQVPSLKKDEFETRRRHRSATVSEVSKRESEIHDTTSKVLPTVFKWEGGGKQVSICGTFSEWKSVPMVKSHGDFVTIIDLPEGEHEYKFCVDGEIKYDPSIGLKDNDGSKTNVITVKESDFEVFQALARDSGTASHQLQTEYGQEIPSNKPWEKSSGPPILPPHLLQVILNKDTPLSCEPTLLPEPNHVMLNHLYALSIKDGVMVLSATHRYRKKYGKSKKTRKVMMQKFAQMKKMISLTDSRIKKEHRMPNRKRKLDDPHQIKERELPQVSSALFFQYNTQLGPPYHILVDTNFVNFAIKNKLDVMQNMMDCLYAKCVPYITDCVMAEMEKLGSRYRIALKIMKDSRFERLACMHKGTYADDCLVQRVTQHKCFIVATNDKDLKRRIRKIPGVPIMYVAHHRFTIERMPDAYGAPKT